MPDERRINIRVDTNTFDDWDDLRHKLKTTWQEVGMNLFSEWYRTATATPQVAPKPRIASNDEIHSALTSLPKSRAALVLEFIRMLETPGPYDQFMIDHITGHLNDPGLQAERGGKEKV